MQVEEVIVIVECVRHLRDFRRLFQQSRFVDLVRFVGLGARGIQDHAAQAQERGIDGEALGETHSRAMA